MLFPRRTSGILSFGTAKFFAAKRFCLAKRLIAPNKFGDPETWNRELVRGKKVGSRKALFPRTSSGIQRRKMVETKTGTANLFAARRFGLAKRLVAPNKFGDPGVWNREVLCG
jgi:hypothetical protein